MNYGRGRKTFCQKLMVALAFAQAQQHYLSRRKNIIMFMLFLVHSRIIHPQPQYPHPV